MSYLCMMRIHSQHTINNIKLITNTDVPRRYVGVLFKFGELSANMTMVDPNATIRAAGDAILVEHDYPTIDKYKPIGRVLSYYVKNNALLIDFEITDQDIIDLSDPDTKSALSVSWFSDNYEVMSASFGSYIKFNDVVIYEVSLVSDPAFNTCIATGEDGLSCLASSVKHKTDIGCCHGGCGCGGKKNSVTLYDMIAKHQEITREEFDALREQVQQALDAIAALANEIKELKNMVGQVPDDMVTELEQAKKKIEQVEMTLSSQASDLAGVLQAAEKLLAITERTYKNLPNLVRK
jgi:FtsZ-binding cell division protein ZapB